MRITGLVNGPCGEVKKLWYKPGSDPRTELPAVAFVEVEGYVNSGKF
jgi:hypothetical protein